MEAGLGYAFASDRYAQAIFLRCAVQTRHFKNGYEKKNKLAGKNSDVCDEAISSSESSNFKFNTYRHSFFFQPASMYNKHGYLKRP